MIRYGDIEVSRSAIAELAAELRRSGDTAVAHKLGHAIDHDLDELVLGPYDYGPIIRALSEAPLPALGAFREVVERRHRLGEDESLPRALAEAREKRKAANEAFFREINERLEARALDTSAAVVLCECADEDCTKRLTLSHAEYEAVRGDSAQFVVMHGHADPEIEEVVSRTDRFEVVRKRGVGVDVAIRLDVSGVADDTSV